jgi:energy-coupling factor transporter ATP-binding protein EcfA2
MTSADPRGSVWRRWDPHIHTPGTAENDQFGPDAWDGYFTKLEKSEPRIEALGITDYCSLDNYETVLRHREGGRLPDVGLIFPNVELRFAIGTEAAAPVNFHLLISPEHPTHIDEARRFLRTLTFKVGKETYACERDDLRALGRAHQGKGLDDIAALEAGTRQFKVGLDVLRQAFEGSEWARENIIVAVTAGSKDGSSGVRSGDGGLEALRREIERIAQVMFTGQPNQREFWLGEGKASVEELEEHWGGPKLCLHGSDAHSLEDVGAPDLDRYSWLKGDPTFETLVQACLEPRDRAIVAPQPPEGALPYQTIDRVTVTDAPWLATPDLPLNPGLIAIIGARGSGKTALAEIIAAGAGSLVPTDESFLARARDHVGGAKVEVVWGDQELTESALAPESLNAAEPYVQHLSQQFVERLCSSEGLAADLLFEIERVIFEEHPIDGRLGAATFHELLDRLAARGRAMRERANEGIDEVTAAMEAERELSDGLPELRRSRGAVAKSLEEDRLARKGILVADNKERTERLQQVTTALDAKQAQVDELRRRAESLIRLGDAVKDYRDRKFPSVATTLKNAHADAGLAELDWAAFAVKFEGDPTTLVADRLAVAQQAVTATVGVQIQLATEITDEVAPIISATADLGTATLSELEAEATRLRALIGLDSAKLQKLQALAAKITTAERRLVEVDARIAKASGAKVRISELSARRQEHYAGIFDGFAEEQQQLAQLYAPLTELLAAEDGALANLTFSVERVVDVAGWAARGEQFIDTRVAGDFRGRGLLFDVATDELLPAWQTGTSAEVAAAMTRFREQHTKSLIAQSTVSRQDVQAYRKWAAAVAAWLNSTDHITLRYGIKYGGVDIRQLSPGTRGIVLLLLYLAVDRSDDRPLLIDQPEENLDPKSIFTELVGRFRSARRRRQIIIVTHNANLVVNTDADQVIVASVGAQKAGALPTISYASGGLENPEIRAQVCEILEGGEQAFKERARRLRLRLT